jgi:hypothetical protein
VTQKKNPAGFNSAQVNGGRRIITGSTRTQKKKRSSRAYICIYYLPVCYCFAIPCCPIAFLAVLLRESCGLYMYACMGKLSKNLDAAFSQAGLHRQLFPEIVRWASCLFEINVYTFVCPHQHGEDYIKSYLDGDSFFFRLGICARHFVRLLSLHYVVPSSSPRTSLKAACLLSGCPVIDVVVVLLLYPSF